MPAQTKETVVKALALSGLTEEAFKALPIEQRREWFQKAQTEPDESSLIEMVRDPAKYPAPHTADVHPDEVENYALSGWVKRAD